MQPAHLVVLALAGLLLPVFTDVPTSASAQEAGAQISAHIETPREALYRRLDGPGHYAQKKALDELMSVAPDDDKTVEALIRLLQSRHAEEPQFRGYMTRVSNALKEIAGRATWSPENVELLTSILVNNDAYDARATDATASTVAAVARHQVFTSNAIGDLTRVLWYRVDKNPNRSRNDNTRSHLMRALRQIHRRQGLPQTVLDAALDSLPGETNSGLQREQLLLLDDIARAGPVTGGMLQVLVQLLHSAEQAAVRVLAAQALRHVCERRNHRRELMDEFLRAISEDPAPAVRREALAGLMAAASDRSVSGTEAQAPPRHSAPALPPGTVETLLEVAAKDTSTRVRYQALEVLGALYATQAPDPAIPRLLLDRLRVEGDDEVRGLIAVTLRESYERQGLSADLIAQLAGLVTDDPLPQVRREISRILLGPSVGQALANWMRATSAMGMSGAGVEGTLAPLQERLQERIVGQPSIRGRLLDRYVGALSAGRPVQVRREILAGLFALSLTTSLSERATDVLARTLISDANAELRLSAAAVLLQIAKDHPGITELFYPALDDPDAKVHTYAAFALVELNDVDGSVLSALLRFAGDASVPLNLRLYSLRRLIQGPSPGMKLLASAQDGLLRATREEDAGLRSAAWSALVRFDLTEQDWRRATADDDIEIQRMAWRQLQALGVSKPLTAMWRDPKERLEIVAVTLVGATLLQLVVGTVFFTWRLFLWWSSDRPRPGRMLAAALLWVLATVATVVVLAGILFVLAMAHRGISERDLIQLNLVFGTILAFYVAAGFLCRRLLPPMPLAAPP